MTTKNYSVTIKHNSVTLYTLTMRKRESLTKFMTRVYSTVSDFQKLYWTNETIALIEDSSQLTLDTFSGSKGYN